MFCTKQKIYNIYTRLLLLPILPFSFPNAFSRALKYLQHGRILPPPHPFEVFRRLSRISPANARLRGINEAAIQSAFITTSLASNPTPPITATHTYSGGGGGGGIGSVVDTLPQWENCPIISDGIGTRANDAEEGVKWARFHSERKKER